ncbi:MAG: hydratase [Sporomusaceae bacterium]|nr:hydratase [Sporomusaceae bacterium]
MIELIQDGVYVVQGEKLLETKQALQQYTCEETDSAAKEIARRNTIAYQLLMSHNVSGDEQHLKLRMDSLASHDITYVGIIQTALAGGLQEFPLPYVLTNCHNSLCAVGGTINEDDHRYGLSAAQKLGGIFVPPHQAVIHQYMREMMAGCGKMILGSDSHTRYGALGTMAFGEGGPELVKQLFKQTYDIAYPEVIAVYLEGDPLPGVGPQDVALTIIGAVFKNGFVKNKILEFVGPGIKNLSVDYRNGIDVMMTETACLSTIWRTDETVAKYYQVHGRPEAYTKLESGALAYYDGAVKVLLHDISPMIALPFHPSNVWTIAELNRYGAEILRETSNDSLVDKLIEGRLQVDQAVVAGCAGGTFENIAAMADILAETFLQNHNTSFSVYPASQPIHLELLRQNKLESFITSGAILRTAFCGPCFGAGDVPANNGLSIRHTTRNFPSREGAIPSEGQSAFVALMDARSIAATVRNGGRLTAATEIAVSNKKEEYCFDAAIYQRCVYQGFGCSKAEKEIVFGPNITPWPTIAPLTNHLLLKVSALIYDPVTTTDELIPSGEASSFRSNPLKLAEFTLMRRDPKYVARAKDLHALEQLRQDCPDKFRLELAPVLAQIAAPHELSQIALGSVIFARKPGDGSAREQAASSQRVLGGAANLAIDYATKRYRSNLINWGMLPFLIDEQDCHKLQLDDYIYLPNIRECIASGKTEITAVQIQAGGKMPLHLRLGELSEEERKILLAGCLINYYAETL